MTPQERKVFELALEALESCDKLINGTESKYGLEGVMDGYYSGCFDVDGNNKLLKEAIATIEKALAQPDRHELQAKGEHPAPCARFCEANSFQIEIRSLKKQLEEAQNGWCKALEKLQIQPDKVCIENDGCPTEKAVLQRFWREHQKTKPEQEPVAWRWIPSEAWNEYVLSQSSERAKLADEHGLNPEPLYTTPQPDKLAYYEKVADDLQALCDKQSLRIAELEKSWIGLNWDDLPEIYVEDKAFLHGAQWAEAKLREKNT